MLELDLPFWTDPDDVRVRITAKDLTISVRGSLDLRRSFWRNTCAHTVLHKAPKLNRDVHILSII